MKRWDADKAWEWYFRQPWLVGCNFIPSTAINQLEMWQADTFDMITMERELGWAAGMGMNTLRVFLHNLAWEQDPDGFKSRIDQFLNLTAKHGIRPFFVLFDDCWNATPTIGQQPEPIPGVHNSGWLQGPGSASVNNPATWEPLEDYVLDILDTFKQDQRILMWDLYNEPGNSEQGVRSLPFLCKVFEWARQVDTSQPLTAGLWCDNKVLNTFQTEASDVITFHNYYGSNKLVPEIANLRQYGRPLICTEWLRRGFSDVEDCLPVFQREHVGCCNWGLVSGKTQTIYPWGSEKGAPEPALWFHDLFHQDSTPFAASEIQLFKALTEQGRVQVSTMGVASMDNLSPALA